MRAKAPIYLLEPVAKRAEDEHGAIIPDAHDGIAVLAIKTTTDRG